MASDSSTLLYSVSLFLILLSLLIHETESQESCPYSFNLSCPDYVHNGEFPTSHFTYTSLLDDHPGCVGGPCELTCDANHTLINCNKCSLEPAYRVLRIDPNNLTIAVEYPDWWMPPDALLKYPCIAYLDLNSSFPLFQMVSFKTRFSENQTFLGCPSPVTGDGYWENQPNTSCGYEKTIVYGPYNISEPPAKNPPTAGCMQFRKYSSSEHSKNKGKLFKIILPVLSGIAVFALIALIVYWRKTKNMSGPTTFPSRIMSLDCTRSDLEEGSINNGVTVFSYAELQEVTNNFDPARELGEGGFGVVYYGKLKDGKEVAVKRMFEKNYKQIEQFKNEIQILTNVRHPNLVTLYGSTSRHSQKLLLVYEYIPNGTVSDHLHGSQSKSVLLLWPTRMKIAIETASALCFLHFKEIIHRDIKTNNILLDKNFSAKVADFGLSRLFPTDVTHVSTAPQGTPGYLDPEYHECYHLTDKSDVYSFGVVLVELISSLPAVDFGRERNEVNLSNYAMNKIQCSAFDELVDPKLGFENSFKVRRMTTLVAELAFRCLQHERELRPSMDEVLEVLKRIESVDYDGLEVQEMGQEISTGHRMRFEDYPPSQVSMVIE